MTVNSPILLSQVRVPTAHASRYLQQLCKHWRHNLAVEFDESLGTVTFPRNARGADWPGDAMLLMQAHDDGLECWLEASADGQLEALKAPSPATSTASPSARRRSPSTGGIR